MKKRTKLEVIKDILETLKNGSEVRITHLIYKSNLSNNSIKPYLCDLQEKGLIVEETKKDKKIFSITKKGKEFSESYGF